MDNSNTVTIGSPKKTNKIVIALLFCVVAVAAVSLYLYTQSKNAKSNIIKPPVVFTDWLYTAKIGEPYKGSVMVVVYNQNVQIDGKVLSGMPPGLWLAKCQTSHNSMVSAEVPTINSYGKCAIEGIPEQNGIYTIKAYFSAQGATEGFYKDFQVGVDP